MNLSRQIAFVGVVLSALACSDPAGPRGLFPGYVLDNISGRALPTFVSPIPEAPIILSATLQLHAFGKATLTERRREMVGGEFTSTGHYTYVVTGNEIQFDYDPPCPPNALCAAPPHGFFVDSRLSLDMYGPNSGVVYNFRFVAPD